MGANGAGKSSLVESVAGLLRPSSGTVTYDGKMISALRAEEIVRQRVAQLFLDQAIEDNLLLGCYWKARDKDYIGERLGEVYERFPVLERKRRDAAATLSGGEQQMLAVSRGLMSQPHILLLDEPSTGLAPLIVQDLMSHLAILRERGLGILLVEQVVGAALKVADRGHVMGHGTIIAEGTGDELLTSGSELVGAYLGGTSKRSRT